MFPGPKVALELDARLAASHQNDRMVVVFESFFDCSDNDTV